MVNRVHCHPRGSWWWVSTPKICRDVYRYVINWIQPHLVGQLFNLVYNNFRAYNNSSVAVRTKKKYFVRWWHLIFFLKIILNKSGNIKISLNIYRVCIKSFPDYKHLLQENYCTWNTNIYIYIYIYIFKYNSGISFLCIVFLSVQYLNYISVFQLIALN